MKKERKVFWFEATATVEKVEERELFDGELCEAEIKGIWGAVKLAVALSDPW